MLIIERADDQTLYVEESWVNSAGFNNNFEFLAHCGLSVHYILYVHHHDIVEPRVKDGIKFYPRLHLSG